MKQLINSLILFLVLTSVTLGQSIHSGSDTTSRNFSAGWYRLGGTGSDYYIIPKTGNAIRLNLPMTGTSGQVLRRTGTLPNAYGWQSLGTMADQNASAVAVTGGTLAGISSFAGTGAITLTGASSNINLNTDGQVINWANSGANGKIGSASGVFTISNGSGTSGADALVLATTGSGRRLRVSGDMIRLTNGAGTTQYLAASPTGVTLSVGLTFPDGTSMTTAATGSGGGGSGSYSDDEVNGFLLATDRLIDVTTTGGMPRNQGYFHQVIARRSVTVGGVSFKITRGGSVSGSTYQNAVALFDVSGNLLAIGDAAGSLGSSGWKKVMFTASVALVAGTKYVIGLVANGDDIPNFAAVNSFGDYNQYAPTGSLRNFRKSSVSTLNATMNFAVDTSPNTSERIFLSLVAP